MKRTQLLAFWPLAVLCLLLSVRWAFADYWPGTQSTRASEAVAALLGMALCVLFALRSRRTPSPASNAAGGLVPAFAAGALLFAGLNPGVLLPDVALRGTDLLVSLALTPVVIAVALVAFGEAGNGLNGIEVAPGILAAAGLLLIVPQPRFLSFAEDAVLVLAPVCIGAGAVWLRGRAQEPLTASRAAAAVAGAAGVFGALALKTPRYTPKFPAIGLDLLTLLLSLLALRRCGVRRFSAQFAVVPLLLLLEGLLLTRVRPGWEQTGGLLLLLVAAVLLVRSSPQPEVGASPHLLT